MAIYSASVKPISRSAGRSATAAAAYRTGSLVIDERQGLIHDYTRKTGVEHVSRHYPHGLADMGTEALWNRAEHAETRKNSTVARELLVALPHELSSQQRNELAESISMALVDRYQVAAESSVHLPDEDGDQRNNHAHIQFSTRRMGPDGMFGEKTRELDDKKQGKQEVEWIRQMVETKINTALEKAGLDVRVDRRSLKAQRAAALAAGELDKAQELDREPTIHLGPRVTQILRECAREGRMPLGALDRAAANDAISLNIVDARAELANLDLKIERAEALESAHVEAIKEDLLRTRIIDIRDKLKEKESRIVEIRNSMSSVVPDFVRKEKLLREQKEKAISDATEWNRKHPIASKIAAAFGYQVEVDKRAAFYAKRYDESPDRLRKAEWDDKKKAEISEHNSLKKEVKLLRYEIAIARNDLKALNDPNKPASYFDLARAKDRVCEKHPESYKATDAFVASNSDALSMPGCASACSGGGTDADFPSEIIRTGNRAIDDLAQKFMQHQKKMLAEELAYIEQQAGVLANQAEKTRQASLKAVQSMFALATAIRLGTNLDEPEKPVTRHDLISLTKAALNDAAELRKAVDFDVMATKKERAEAVRQAEIDAEIERNTRTIERERELREYSVGNTRAKKERKSRYEFDEPSR